MANTDPSGLLKTLSDFFKNQLSEADKGITRLFSISSGIGAIISQLQKIPQEVLAVNSAILELRRESNASASDISSYFDKAAESAKKYGLSLSSMINATTGWARLGYGLPDSQKLAEAAALYANISNGTDIYAANEALSSILQGFHLQAEDAMEVIDKLSAVSGRFPAASAGTAAALQAGAASFHDTGTGLSKSVALSSAGQDPDALGSLWETVGMRISSAKQELEAAGEETDGMLASARQLRDYIRELTGFDIMADTAGAQCKDIYDIVVGIGHEWENLTDTEQSGLLDALAGNGHADTLRAALDNVSLIEEAYRAAENSAGSALREQEAYEQGIQYSLDRLGASFQTFANHTLDSSLLKGIIDFGNGAVNIIDAVASKIGSLGTIGLGAGLLAGAKNTGKCRMSVRIS